MTTFFLVRHGETEWNVERRIQGWADSPLTSLGLAQAEVHGQLLGQFGIDRIIGSPLGRAMQTVAPIVRETNVPAEYDVRLREVCMGDWSGRTSLDCLLALWNKQTFERTFATYIMQHGRIR